MSRPLVTGIAALGLCVAVSSAAEPEIRLTPAEMTALATHAAGTGTSGITGIVTTVLAGDPGKAGPYTIRLSVPAHTRIAPHAHRDERAAVVVSGTWYFGYGRTVTDAGKKSLPQGSFYSEPAGVAHFAETKDEPVVVYITGYGPSDTVYVNPADDPRK
jgi:quercetin dioxygenase-like cupin family protein